MHRRNLSIVLLVVLAGCGPSGEAGSDAPLKAGPGQELVNFSVPMH